MSIDVLPTPTAAAPPRRSPWHRLLRDPQAVISAGILLILLVLGVLAPLLTQHGPNDSSLQATNAAAGTPGYPLGGDGNGRDILSRLLYSINTSYISAVIGAGVALAIGVTLGLIAGYFGSRLRSANDWTFNLIMTFPGLLALIVLMPVTKGDFRITMVVFGVLLSPGIYRIVRNSVLGVKNELFVDAARVSGLSNLRILGRHVLFVVRGPIIIAAAFLAGSAIGVQSGLAFLGIGAATEPSFGAMIASGFLNIRTQPMQFIWPSVVLGVITAAFVLLGNSLRDAFEGMTRKAPKAKRHAPGVTGSRTRGAADDDTLVVEDLAVGYPSPSGELREVVSGVSLTLTQGTNLGLVGESGSGKTQTAFAILGVLPPEAVIMRGSIRLAGRELLGLSEKELRKLRGREVAYIPQEPMSNLDPSFTVGAQLVQGLRATTKVTKRQARGQILALLARVGITDPDRTFASYPHQISGGMAQRVLIAGAVASHPKLLIADEPTTALDVTVQAEILDLLRELQAELGMAVLLVSHNLGVVADICDRVAVMQKGRIVEIGSVLDIFHAPQHPYTQMLLNSTLDDDFVREDLPAQIGAHPEGASR